jgi:hypothetical protein
MSEQYTYCPTCGARDDATERGLAFDVVALQERELRYFRALTEITAFAPLTKPEDFGNTGNCDDAAYYARYSAYYHCGQVAKIALTGEQT